MSETALNAIDKIKRLAPFFMSAILFTAGLIDLRHALLTESVESAKFKVAVISSTVRMSFAIVMFLDPGKTIQRTVAFYAFGLGMGRLISYFPDLFSPDNQTFIVALVMSYMGFNLSYSGYRYLRGNTRGRIGMTANAALQIAILVVMEMMGYIFSVNYGYEIESMKGGKVGTYVAILQYLLLLLIMDTSEVRYGTPLERMNTRLDSIRMSYSVDPGLKMERGQATLMKHMFDDRSSWKILDDEGPAECEAIIRVIDGRAQLIMTLQKWKDKDCIYVTMTGNEGTVINANRFHINSVTSDGDDDTFTKLRFFDEDRLVLQVLAEPKKKEVPQ